MEDTKLVGQSLTASVKQMFDNDSALPYAITSATINNPSLESVYEAACAKGMTLQEYVQADPEKAVKEAEQSLSQWEAVLTQATLTGSITTDDGTFGINKNQTTLLTARVHQAQEQLDKVNEYAFTCFTDGEKRKDHLIHVLYNRAVHGHDTKAAMYLIDRVDGRPAETRVAELDYDNAYNIYQIIHTLFNKQLDVLNSGNGTKLICCSRRAGKSHLLTALCLIECMRKPNTICIYIGETMELTENIIAQAANEITDTCGLRDKRGKRFDWKKMDNGSQLLIRGLSNTKDPDQIRGNKAKVIVIDEFFHLKSELLSYLQEQVLQPMQMDYADDYKFICAGTPPPIKGTFGEHAWKHWEVSHFSWTWRDNPHPVDVDARAKYVERVLKEKGLDWTSPFARREYNGEWIYDEDLVLYPDVHTYDVRESIPQLHVDMVLFGLDYGVSDNDALIGIAWDSTAYRGYVFHEDKFNRLDIKDRTISQLEYLRRQVKLAWAEALEFFPNMTDREANKRILWDADDNDQHLTDDLNINVRLDDHPDIRLNIQNAHKTDRVIMFDKLKDLFRTAGLLLPKGGKTEHECVSTVLKRGPNGEVYPEVDSSVFHPDLLPALRYAMYNVLGK